MHNLTKNASSNFSKPYVFALLVPAAIPPFIIMGVACWVVNITVLITIFVDRLHCLRKTWGYFVANLCLASILSATSVVLIGVQYISKVKHEFYGNFLYVNLTSSATSSFCFMFILSVERLLFISMPFRYKRFMSTFRARVITLCTWIFSIFNGFLVFWILKHQSSIYKWLLVPLGLSFSSVIIIDIQTFVEIRRRSVFLRNMTENNNCVQQAKQARLRMEKKFAQVVIFLMLNFMFFACQMFVIDSLIRFDISCNGCIFHGRLHDKLYCMSLFLYVFHDINSAMFYLVLIPKYRLSFIAMWSFFKRKITIGQTTES